MITQARAGATVYHDGVYPDVFTEMGINQRTTPAAPSLHPGPTDNVCEQGRDNGCGPT